MLHTPDQILRVVHAEQESSRARVAPPIDAECTAAALEVFERQRRRAAMGGGRTAWGARDALAPVMFLCLLFGGSPGEEPGPADPARFETNAPGNEHGASELTGRSRG